MRANKNKPAVYPQVAIERFSILYLLLSMLGGENEQKTPSAVEMRLAQHAIKANYKYKDRRR